MYRIKSPERATLELAPDPHGEWHICQLEKACNQPVSRKTREAVKAWLSEHQTGL